MRIEEAPALQTVASHPSPQLMERRQSQPFGPHDHDGAEPRQADSHFDDRGRQQDPAPFPELQKHLFFIFVAAVGHIDPLEALLPESPRLVDGLIGNLLALLHQRIDNEHLMLLFQLRLDVLQKFGKIATSDDAGVDRFLEGGLGDEADVDELRLHHRLGPRDGGGGELQVVGTPLPLAHQRLQHRPLPGAEAVLLIHHHQGRFRQILQIEQRVGADDEVGLSVIALHSPLHHQGRLQLLRQMFTGLFIELLGQDRGGGHENRTFFAGHRGGSQNYHGLAAAHIPDDHPAGGPLFSCQIQTDRFDNVPLILRQGKGKFVDKRLRRCFQGLESRKLPAFGSELLQVVEGFDKFEPFQLFTCRRGRELACPGILIGEVSSHQQLHLPALQPLGIEVSFGDIGTDQRPNLTLFEGAFVAGEDPAVLFEGAGLGDLGPVVVEGHLAVDHMAAPRFEEALMVGGRFEKLSGDLPTEGRKPKTHLHPPSPDLPIGHFRLEGLGLARFDPGAQAGILIGAWQKQGQIQQSADLQFAKEGLRFRLFHRNSFI